MAQLISSKIKNLDDLRSERDRLELEYRNMEENWYTLIIPGEEIGKKALIGLWVYYLERKKRKGRVNIGAKENHKKTKLKAAKIAMEKEEIKIKVETEPTFAGKAKKFGKRLLIWQAVSLAFFVGSAVYFGTKRRKQTKP